MWRMPKKNPISPTTWQQYINHQGIACSNDFYCNRHAPANTCITSNMYIQTDGMEFGKNTETAIITPCSKTCSVMSKQKDKQSGTYTVAYVLLPQTHAGFPRQLPCSKLSGMLQLDNMQLPVAVYEHTWPARLVLSVWSGWSSCSMSSSTIPPPTMYSSLDTSFILYR